MNLSRGEYEEAFIDYMLEPVSGAPRGAWLYEGDGDALFQAVAAIGDTAVSELVSRQDRRMFRSWFTMLVRVNQIHWLTGYMEDFEYYVEEAEREQRQDTAFGIAHGR